MENSILNTIKKMLGLADDYTYFDTDIIVAINTALSELHQIGIGSEPFAISGTTQVWSDFIGNNTVLEMAKSYVYLKAKMIFDPSANSTILKAQQDMLAEYAWRINVAVDPERS